MTPMTPMPRAHRTHRARRRRPEEQGVSTVLGAVLMFGLFVIALVVVQVKFVPVWAEDRQAEHMATLADELAVLKADMDRQAGNATASAITDPLTLSSGGGFRFFSGGGERQADLAFTPSAANGGVTLASPKLRLQVRGGINLYGLDEQWTAITTGGTVTDVLRVDHLRVRVDMTPAYDDGDAAQLTFTGADNALAGRVVVKFLDFPSENALEVKVYGPSNNEISSDLEAFFQQTGLTYFYVDLLDPGLLVRDILGAAQPPFRIALAKSGLEAAYTIAYASGALGGGIVGAGGLTFSNFTSTQGSGKLVVDAKNPSYVDQKFTLEHGALILEQPDGAVMAVPPQLAVTGTSTAIFMDWLIPGTSGAPSGFGGARAASVILQPGGLAADFTAAAGALNFTIPTAYGAVWAAQLHGLMQGAGLSSSGAQPEYRITTTSTQVKLEVFGPTPAPADATEDIALRFRQAAIVVQIRPSG